MGEPLVRMEAEGSLRALEPSSGPHRGGTNVSVLGMKKQLHSLASSPSQITPMCRFGAAVVRATAHAAVLTCTTPAAAEAESELVVVRGDTVHVCAACTCELSGTATHDSGVDRLTHAQVQGSGQLTIAPRIDSDTWPRPFAAWVLQFEAVNVGSGGGISVSVGTVPASGVGGRGGGEGLRIAFEKHWHSVKVEWRGELLRSLVLDAQQPDGPHDVAADVLSGGTLAPDDSSWRAVRVAYYPETGLRVDLDGVTVVPSLRLRAWEPRIGWRLVLGASNGPRVGWRWLRTVQLQTDAAIHSSSVPLAVSLNGQQFGRVGRFRYYAHPTVRSAWPSSGPHAGGTRVLVEGRVFDDAGMVLTAMHTSAHPVARACLFGDQSVPATYQAPSGLLACVSPPLPEDATAVADGGGSVSTQQVPLSIELTRDAQALTTDPARRAIFTYSRATLGAVTVTPAAAPIRGGTLLTFAGAGLLGGTVCSCRFDLGALRVTPRQLASMTTAYAEELASPTGFNASRAQLPSLTLRASIGDGIGGPSVRCLSPSVELTYPQMVAGAGASLPISVSLNGQQYTALSQPLRLHEPPTLQFISPACGPARGGTRLTMVGSQLWGGSAYRCRFGGTGYAGHASNSPLRNETVTEATYIATLQGGMVRCSTPASSAVPSGRWSISVALSLNAQQFHLPLDGHIAPSTAPTFQASPGHSLYVQPDANAHVLPAAITTSQVVSLYAHDLHGGCAYACRFDRLGEADGMSVGVPGTFDALRSQVSCVAPSWSAGSIATVLVSLNGQQFSHSGANLTWL